MCTRVPFHFSLRAPFQEQSIPVLEAIFLWWVLVDCPPGLIRANLLGSTIKSAQHSQHLHFTQITFHFISTMQLITCKLHQLFITYNQAYHCCKDGWNFHPLIIPTQQAGRGAGGSSMGLSGGKQITHPVFFIGL